MLALLDHLGVARAHYAGLSLGGMVGMWLAAHAPERVDRLALVCTAAFLPPAKGGSTARRRCGPAASRASPTRCWPGGSRPGSTPARRRAPCCWARRRTATRRAARRSPPWTCGPTCPASRRRRWSSRRPTTWPSRRRWAPRSRRPCPARGSRSCPAPRTSRRCSDPTRSRTCSRGTWPARSWVTRPQCRPRPGTPRAWPCGAPCSGTRTSTAPWRTRTRSPPTSRT
ncbi:alpha/beta fold hydrolase [Luedemannella flava]